MSALVIFAVNVKAVAGFYQSVVGFSAQPKPGDSKKDIRLGKGSEELLIHSIAPRVAEAIVLESPPIAREYSALKPVFDVDLLSAALEQVKSNGGVVTDRAFTLDGLTRCDILDPEGNIVQLRSAVV